MERRLAEFLQNEYDLTLESASRPPHGVSNVTYDLRCAQGRFILKLVDPKSVSSLEAEQRYADYAREAGLPVPTVRRQRNGTHSAIFDGHPAIIVVHVTGSPVPGVHSLRSLGEAIGTLNTLPIPPGLPPRPENRLIWNEFLAGCEDASLLAFFRRKFLPLHERFEASDLPKGIIHGDVWEGNALFDEAGRVAALLDWEMADVHHRLWDVCDAAIGTCRRAEAIDTVQFAQFLEGYARSCPLSAQEKRSAYDYLRYVTLWAVAWRYVKFEIRTKGEREGFFKEMVGLYGWLEQNKTVIERLFR